MGVLGSDPDNSGTNKLRYVKVFIKPYELISDYFP